MNLPLNDWKKRCILQVCLYLGTILNVSTVKNTQVKYVYPLLSMSVFQRGFFFFWQIFVSEASLLSAQVDRNEMGLLFSPESQTRAFPATILCLWGKVYEGSCGNFSERVNTALGVGLILYGPTESLLYFIQWNTKTLLLSPNLLYKIVHAPLVVLLSICNLDHRHSTVKSHIYQRKHKKTLEKKK